MDFDLFAITVTSREGGDQAARVTSRRGTAGCYDLKAPREQHERLGRVAKTHLDFAHVTVGDRGVTLKVRPVGMIIG